MAGRSITIVGEVFNVPFASMVVDAMSLEAKAKTKTKNDDPIERRGFRQRGLHVDSVVDASLRASGWDYNRGGVLRLIELIWTQVAWDAAVAAQT